MSYTPNFNDVRVQNRIRHALGFACAVLSPTKSHAWSSRYIDRFFGQSSHDLSKYLRQQLLICTDEYYRFNSDANKCKEYRLNTQGVEFLRNKLNFESTTVYPSVLQVLAQEHASELHTGNFTYQDKSNRLWHPLQKYRRAYKRQILGNAGYVHQYDIQCAAPTLIHQYSQARGQDEYLFAIEQYLSNRSLIRARLARDLELPTDAIKEIINALFCGASISNNSYSDISEILGADLSRIEFLKQDQYIQELVSDIRICWSSINPLIPRRRNAETNRLIRITCRQRWQVYFELERSVLNAIRKYLDQKSVRYFLEHDGWSSDSEIDLTELSEFVRNQTGFRLNFEYLNLSAIPYTP